MLLLSILNDEIVEWGIDLKRPQPFLAPEHDNLHTTAGNLGGNFNDRRDYSEYCSLDNGSTCLDVVSRQLIDNPGTWITVAVPAPSSLVLIAVGLAGLGFAKYRRD